MEDSTIEKAIIYRAICAQTENLLMLFEFETLTHDSIMTEDEFIRYKIDLKLEVSALNELKKKYRPYKNDRLWKDAPEHTACNDLIEKIPLIMESKQRELNDAMERCMAKSLLKKLA